MTKIRMNEPRLLTAEQMKVFIQVYPTMPFPEMEELFGRTAKQLAHKAEKMRLRRDRCVPGLRQMLLAAGADGFFCSELKGYRFSQIFATAQKLRVQGKLFIGKTCNKNAKFFDSKAKADAYVAKLREPKPKKVSIPKTRAHIRIAKPTKLRAGWLPSDPMIIPKGLKIQRAPTPPRALYSNTHSRW
jgi:hypothetical protein